MRGAVVAEGDADDAGLGMFCDPNNRLGFAGREVPAGGQYLDRCALFVPLETIQLVGDFE